MKKLLICIAAATVLIPAAGVAHPILGPYDTKGECERVFVDYNKAERLRDQDADTTIGDTQSEIHNKFVCAYHEDGDDFPYDRGAGWYFTDIRNQ
jgi:hypothetical protein